jgi:hypothetical protein
LNFFFAAKSAEAKTKTQYENHRVRRTIAGQKIAGNGEPLAAGQEEE